MKYKNIKSVAHNLGHSFLSDMNALTVGSTYTIVPQRLFAAAAVSRVPQVRIDLIGGTVEPDVVAVPEVREAVGHYQRNLPAWLERQNVTPSAIIRAKLTLDFDYTRARTSTHEPVESVQEFKCTVELVDDRGAVHVGRPVQWWRS